MRRSTRPQQDAESTGISGKVLAGAGVVAVAGLVAGGVAWSRKRKSIVEQVALNAKMAADLMAGRVGTLSGPDTTTQDINTGLNTAKTAVEVGSTVADLAAAL